MQKRLEITIQVDLVNILRYIWLNKNEKLKELILQIIY